MACRGQSKTRTLTTDNFQPKTCWPCLQRVTYMAEHCPQKYQKRALLKACLAFFKYIIRIPLWRPPWYPIVPKINAFWFVWFCVCNALKQNPCYSLRQVMWACIFFLCKTRFFVPIDWELNASYLLSLRCCVNERILIIDIALWIMYYKNPCWWVRQN